MQLKVESHSRRERYGKNQKHMKLIKSLVWLSFKQNTVFYVIAAAQLLEERLQKSKFVNANQVQKKSFRQNCMCAYHFWFEFLAIQVNNDI